MIHQGLYLSILPLTGLYELETVKCMYLNQRNELPLPLQTLFTTNANIHGHNTRHRHDPHINTRRTETLSHSFIHKAPALWYTVPSQIQNVKTVGSFRSKIKRELLNKSTKIKIISIFLVALAYWRWDRRAVISGTLDIAVVLYKYFVMYNKFHLLFFLFLYNRFIFQLPVVALYRALQPLSNM